MIAGAVVLAAVAVSVAFGSWGAVLVARHIFRFAISLFTNEELQGGRGL